MAYHVVLATALVLGRLHIPTARALRSCDRPHHFPYFVLVALIHFPLRASFVGLYRLSIILAEDLTRAERDHLWR